MLTIVYPFSKKAALFWSNYITDHTSRIFFAILKCYRKFYFLGDRESKKDLPEQFLIMSNHQSLIDIVVYLVYFSGHKVRFVAKDALGKAPMVGKMLRSQQHCIIPRTGKTSVAMKKLQDFADRVNEDKLILPLIFPEGTRSLDGNLKKFYSAGLRRVEDTVNLPIVTCALDGGWKIGKITTFFKNLYKGSYRVKVLKVFDPPEDKAGYIQILDESAELMQKQLDYWRSLPAQSLEV